MFSTILFDFDGTLSPSLELWLQAFKYAFQSYGLDLDEDTIIREYFYRDYREIAVEFGLPSPEDLARRIDTGLNQAFVNVRLYPMVRELLEECKKTDLSTGIVTSAPRQQVVSALSKTDLTGFFDVVVTANDVNQFKPNPEPVLLALERLGKPATEALYVGDHEVDIRAGKAAGVTTALFLPEENARFYQLEALLATGPDFVFHSHSEIIDYLDSCSRAASL